METIQITTLEQVPAGLTRLFKELADLRVIIEDNAGNQTPVATSDGELLTRQQTAERLKISLPTLNELTKAGKIIGYRIGNRLRYKAAEVQQALTKIKTGGNYEKA